MNVNFPSHRTELDGVYTFAGRDELGGQYSSVDTSYTSNLDSDNQKMHITTEIVDFCSGKDSHPLEGEDVIQIGIRSRFADNGVEEEGRTGAYMRKDTARAVAFHLLDCIQQMEED